MNVGNVVFSIMIIPDTGCSLPEAQKIAEDSVRYFSLPSWVNERQKHDLAKGDRSVLPRTVMRTHSKCIYLLQTKGDITLLGKGCEAKIGKVLVIDQQGFVQLKKGKIVFDQLNPMNLYHKIQDIQSPYLDILSGPYTYTSEKKNKPRSFYLGELLAPKLSHPRWNKLSLVQILSILENVASGLAILHARDLVHIDIKPDNILVRFNPQHFDLRRFEGVIADFGFLSEKDSRGILCTPLWLSPEAAKNLLYTTARDIWAFGLVAYYRLSVNKRLPEFINKIAYTNEGFIKRLQTLSDTEITYEKVFPKGWSKFPVSERLESLILWCFSMEAIARPDAKRLARVLREIIAEIQNAESAMILEASEKQ